MKPTAAILLTIVLSANCLYRLGMFTYFQVEYDYIVSVLCVNRNNPIAVCSGKCFLDRNVFLEEEEHHDTFPKEEIKSGWTDFLIAGFNFKWKLATPEPKVSHLIKNDDDESLHVILDFFQPPEGIYNLSINKKSQSTL